LNGPRHSGRLPWGGGRFGRECGEGLSHKGGVRERGRSQLARLTRRAGPVARQRPKGKGRLFGPNGEVGHGGWTRSWRNGVVHVGWIPSDTSSVFVPLWGGQDVSRYAVRIILCSRHKSRFATCARGERRRTARGLFDDGQRGLAAGCLRLFQSRDFSSQVAGRVIALVLLRFVKSPVLIEVVAGT